MSVEVKVQIHIDGQVNFNLFHYQPIWHRSQNDVQYDDLWEISRDLLFSGQVYFENIEGLGMTQLVEGIQRRNKTLETKEREYPMLINFPLAKIVVICCDCIVELLAFICKGVSVFYHWKLLKEFRFLYSF